MPGCTPKSEAFVLCMAACIDYHTLSLNCRLIDSLSDRKYTHHMFTVKTNGSLVVHENSRKHTTVTRTSHDTLYSFIQYISLYTCWQTDRPFLLDDSFLLGFCILWVICILLKALDSNITYNESSGGRYLSLFNCSTKEKHKKLNSCILEKYCNDAKIQIPLVSLIWLCSI